MHTYSHVHICIYMKVYMYICMHTYLFLSLTICIHIHIYIHIHFHVHVQCVLWASNSHAQLLAGDSLESSQTIRFNRSKLSLWAIMAPTDSLYHLLSHEMAPLVYSAAQVRSYMYLILSFSSPYVSANSKHCRCALQKMCPLAARWRCTHFTAMAGRVASASINPFCTLWGA